MDIQTLRRHLDNTQRFADTVPVKVYEFVIWCWYKELNTNTKEKLLDKYKNNSIPHTTNLAHSDDELTSLWAQFLMENNHEAP